MNLEKQLMINIGKFDRRKQKLLKETTSCDDCKGTIGLCPLHDGAMDAIDGAIGQANSDFKALQSTRRKLVKEFKKLGGTLLAERDEEGKINSEQAFLMELKSKTYDLIRKILGGER